MKKSKIILILLLLILIMSSCKSQEYERGEEASSEPLISSIEQDENQEMDFDYPEELGLIAGKETVGEYTNEDLYYLLNSTMLDLGHAYGVAMDEEFYGGNLFAGHTLTSQGVTLCGNIYMTGQYNSEKGWLILPTSLYLSGEYREETPFEGFVFGMEIAEVEGDVYHIEDSFFKRFEGFDKEPAKCIRLEEDYLAVELYFLDFGDGNFILYDIGVKLKGSV